MRHIDPDTLALLALGEPAATPDDAAHLRSCPVCEKDLDSLVLTAQLGRDSLAEVPLAVPHPAVWSRIAADLGIEESPRWEARQPEPSGSGPVAPVRPLRTRLLPLLAAAAAIVALVAVGGIAWQLLRPTPPAVIATANLDAFPAWPSATGSAVVEERANGERVVRLSLAAPAGPGDYREAWLITGDASALVSLGVVRGGEATLPIPDDIDIDRYQLVDVSAEADDGDPAHSGDSIVRGQLQAAG